MQSELLSILRDDEPLAAILGEHNGRALIDFITRPRKSNLLPALSLLCIEPPDNADQDGQDNLRSTRVQFDFFGARYEHCRTAFRRTREILTPRDGAFVRFVGDDEIIERVSFEGSRDLDVTELNGGGTVFHLEADFIIWHRGIAE